MGFGASAVSEAGRDCVSRLSGIPAWGQLSLGRGPWRVALPKRTLDTYTFATGKWLKLSDYPHWGPENQILRHRSEAVGHQATVRGRRTGYLSPRVSALERAPLNLGP